MHTKTKPANRKHTKRQQAKKTRPQRKRTSAPRVVQATPVVVEATKPLVTADVVSRFTGIPRGTVYVMARRQMIPCYKTGANRYALRFAIAEVLEALRVPAMPEAPGVEPPPTGDEAKG